MHIVKSTTRQTHIVTENVLKRKCATTQKHVVNKNLHKNKLYQHAKVYCKIHHHVKAYI